MSKLFSYRDRPFHYGAYPLEDLPRSNQMPDLTRLVASPALRFHHETPHSIINAMAEYQAMMDAIREGGVKKERAEIPDDPQTRANHLKSFGYFCDADMVGVCHMPQAGWLNAPMVNPDVARLSEDLKTRQTKTLAAGIDVIMAMLREAMEAPATGCQHHTHALVFLYRTPRKPRWGEAGCEWIQGAEAHRSCLRATETASILANYIRLLGFEARAHSMAAGDVHLGRLAVASGLATIGKDASGTPTPINPLIGHEFGLAAVTTTLEISPDKPLAGGGAGIAWLSGHAGNAKTALNREPYARRNYVDGAHPFETLKRVEEPTTFIDEPRVARVPKRTDMFARAQFGDMGPALQKAATAGNYVRKSATAFAFRPPLGAMVLLQDGPAKTTHMADDPVRNAENIKATSYWLGVDAVGLSRCPDWAYYSHDAAGAELEPYHSNAISMIIDQGHETMDGASGDDWIAAAQSMRAYLRFSVLGGVIAQQIRNLGYTARVHSVMDGEVLQPPLLLLSGLGEVSRIGEVILNPFLGPRLKSGAVTTNMPMTHDKPINFGMQRFCEACNKCARECPSGAITAGPKKMFNGYEIWKSDSQKCTTYRVTSPGGAMCGRCMKTCPWNLEGLFAEAPFRWAAMKFPRLAKGLATLDDALGNGEVNDTKKWWWDLGMENDGPYEPPCEPVHRRALQRDLELSEQTLAVYPAPLAPPPFPYPFPMDREQGIAAHEALLDPAEHKARLARGETDLVPQFTPPEGPPPVFQLVVSKVEKMTDSVTKYEFRMPDGSDLPSFEAGAHIDVVVAPEFLRQFSLSGDPSDRSRYQIAVLREDVGRGGSRLIHRIFSKGRKVFVSQPINHFALEETTPHSLLMGGGIGITPMIAMAHRLHALKVSFSMHYSCHTRAEAGFLNDLENAAWASKVSLHFSDEDNRVDLETLLANQPEGSHLYTCGPDRYMDAVLNTATRLGWDEDHIHREYFSVPEQPEYENHPFKVELTKSGKTLAIPADKSITDVLAENSVHVDVKCSDGLCGVCKCSVLEGKVEHRDFVLSNSQQANAIILCQSRAALPGGLLRLDI